MRNLSDYPKLIYYFGDKHDSVNLEKLGIKMDNIVMCEQVHGNRLSILDSSKIKLIKGTDGMITGKTLIIGIRTADCLPIFFFDPKIKIIAAIHAGWKGLSTGIINNAISAMKKLGCNLKDLIASIGPHIQICCYNVPEDRTQKFLITNRSYSLHLLPKILFCELRSNSWYLDLGKIALLQLNSLGVKKSNIEISDICTSCDNNYWSFRRDGKRCGRMLNVIGLRS